MKTIHQVLLAANDNDLNLTHLIAMLFVNEMEQVQPDMPARISDVAVHICRSTARTTGLVDALCEEGIMERKRSVTDRREIFVILTEQGKTLLTEITQ